MSFFEDLIVSFGQEIIFKSFKWIGTRSKWLFYLGKRPVSQIKIENWNTRIGFIIFNLLIITIIFLVNNTSFKYLTI